MPKKSGSASEPAINRGQIVIGIGASAGGLDALTAFFEHVPDHTGFSYVVVQHLSPDHKSLMGELLSKHTVMKVIEAEEDLRLQPDCVYLIPSKKFMTVRAGRLRLQDKNKSSVPNNAIDVFFESLATEYRDHAIGVVLSGTGTDGTKGIEAIKENGGIIIVQDPITAEFDGMPNSAISADVADMILPPENMLPELIDYLSEPASSRAFHIDAHRDEMVLRDILVLIRKVTGHDFGYYKRPTLYRRLSKRLSELNIRELKDYFAYMTDRLEEVKLICQEFLINVTKFFRDEEAFEIIRTQVMPAMLRDKTPGDTVKIWSVACSTGEEAYTMAILIDEYMETNKISDINVKIFATDIDKAALETASQGIYSRASVKEISAARLSKYFVAKRDSYKVSTTIRRMVVFSYHDILRDPPFSRMDLISCRNMLIYINSEYQKEILNKLHFALNLDGYLFLGPSEDVDGLRSVLDEVDKKWRIYKCIAKTRINSNNTDSFFSPMEKNSLSFVLPKPKTKNPLNYISDIFRDTLLEQESVAGIYIDPNMEVKQATGNYKRFIDLPETGFNFNLMKLVPVDLGISLSVAIRKAQKDHEPVTMRSVQIHQDNKVRYVSITVKPYLHQKEYDHQFLFIILREEDKPKASDKKSGTKASPADQDRMAELEKELKETRSNLQAVIEEVETANEELQSSNEEMLSTNEELQSTNEELQSLNEELHTVSAEHQLKIKEMMELNDDMNNYFNNSEIGQIIIDRKLIIRKFSPAVTRMVNLIDADINRSIVDITTRFKNLDFVSDIRQAMIDGRVMDKEIVLGPNTYLMRIAPYVRQDRSTDGVVVNFIDVTDLKRVHSILEAVLDSTPSAIDAKRSIRNSQGDIIDFEYITANKTLEESLGLEPGSMVGKSFRMLQMESGREHFFELYREVVETGGSKHFEYYLEKRDKWYEIVLVKMLDGLVTIATDITDKKKAADIIAQSYEDLKHTSGRLQSMNIELEQSNMDLVQFASVASHDLKEPLRKIQTYGNMLYDKVKDKLNSSELANLDKIVAASDRMQRLIEDVLTFSKLSNRDLVLQDVNLNDTLARILDDLEITVRDKKTEFVIGKLPIVRAVQGQMHQLFQNLISNAIKFSDRVKPKITISEKDLTPHQIKDLNIDPRDYICITVKDNGIGFEQEYSNKIFGIFQRLNGNNYEGTGIGLAICKKILENHNGFLFAESKLNEGAEFFIVLPR